MIDAVSEPTYHDAATPTVAVQPAVVSLLHRVRAVVRAIRHGDQLPESLVELDLDIAAALYRHES